MMQNPKQRVVSAILFAMGIAVGLLPFLFMQPGKPAPAVVHAAEAPTVATESLAPAPMLSYQARLLEPGNGAPKPNGVYQITFRLYNVATDGSAIWSETKDLTVKDGLFSTLLGNATPLDLTHFNGQDLWLAVKVGVDPEATPRQQVAFTAYALYAANAAQLGGQTVDTLASKEHRHSGSDVDAGVVGEPFIDPTIARDSEIISIVKANDGAGSAVDADTLDGVDSSGFATSSHNHDARYFIKRQGTQFTGTLSAGATATWFTHSWATDEVVIWAAYPTSPGGKIEWSVDTELESSGGVGNGKIKYHITVHNVGSVSTNIEGRYVIFR